MRALATAIVLAGLSVSGVLAELPVGGKVAEINVTLNGAPLSIAPAKADATVVVFMSTTCPISNAYNDRMSALYSDYRGKNVQFVFVNANRNESPAAIEEHAHLNKLPFKIYKDVNNVLADAYGASVTPETYVFDKTGTLQYHGSIDDAQNPARAQVHGLRQALDSVLAAKPVTTKETKAFGCTIKKVRKTT